MEALRMLNPRLRYDQRKFNRKQTGKNSWEEAKAVAALWERTNWDGEIPASEPAAQPEPVAKTNIEKAIAAYLAGRPEILASNTQRQNKAILSKLKAFSETRGYVLVEQWTPLDIREFRASWGVAPHTAAKNMAIVKSFFGLCTDNDWIAKNPTKRVIGIRSRSNGKERVSFTDEELKRMYDACETQYSRTHIRWSRDIHHQPAKGEVANYRYKWTGQDLADFISVSVYTGLRISDVAIFHADRLLASGECHVRTTKTGRKVYTWIPEWLKNVFGKGRKSTGR